MMVRKSGINYLNKGEPKYFGRKKHLPKFHVQKPKIFLVPKVPTIKVPAQNQTKIANKENSPIEFSSHRNCRIISKYGKLSLTENIKE